ncbi:MAG: polyribonucleotide nucleotidyltransferase [Gemmatales bacterium]|nr:polyribonucleotide nucleotidyltransferase [Gemmatales bacterium]MCS7161157.1 polyribonucleotide nucleotidyltransferase [Gemmatales bacterium]MDW8176360.1 polyribonucleotide nucleotidyltransferase [Gemmatales bacterium]MDW8221696.1 polyribonucleotide nucleotidyltransferase [Gemmatales bacterium]
MSVVRVEQVIGRHTLAIETGKLAKQAHGAVTVQYADSVVLVAVVEGTAQAGQDFFPLVVDYREKTYAAGKFPGGFIKREGRPTTKEILTSRLIDRPIRPLFPPNYVNEVQIHAIVLSADPDYDPDVLAMIGASAALHISPIPFLGPTGAIRLGRVQGQLIVLPTYDEVEQGELDLVVSGNRQAVTMIEGFAQELSEEEMVQAIVRAHREALAIIDMIADLRHKLGLPPKEIPPPSANPLKQVFCERFYQEMLEAKRTPKKQERKEKVEALKQRIAQEYIGGTIASDGTPTSWTEAQIHEALTWLEKRVVRDLALQGHRLDGRGLRDLRPVSCEVGVLPRTHGSAVFTRGETQALVTTTLGTVSDEQRVEGLVEEYTKKFMLDYNFPPFSVGEVRPIRGPGRREVGHGALAERSLKAVIPAPEEFPYTIRVVSEILESNGSSSMATVCGATLSLMDAGVPIYQPVAGISIGLVKEDDRYVLLTDIMGDEDHYGDMDFKVAGTGYGITGIQLDLKIDGINEQIIRETLLQAREARHRILQIMLQTLPQPRPEISKNAPRLFVLRIDPEKIGLLIGPGGKTIKAIQDETHSRIDISEDGTVAICCYDPEKADLAVSKVRALTEEVRVGNIYDGKVVGIKEFGAFVEVLPGKDGLVHISELDDKFVSRVEDVVKLGDRIPVKVIAIDEQDRLKLSRKAALRELREKQAVPGEVSSPSVVEEEIAPPSEAYETETAPARRESYRERREPGRRPPRRREHRDRYR